MKRLAFLGLSLLALSSLSPRICRGEPSSAVPAAGASASSFLVNGSMESDSDGDGWPDAWPRTKNVTREVENGNHFLRLTCPKAGETVLIFHKIPLPAGAKALELSWRQRVSNLKTGKMAWFDARIMLEFRDAQDQIVRGAPGAPAVRRDTDGWQQRSIQFLVPEGAASFVMMPTLFQVQSGTFDLDDVSLKPIDEAPVRAKAEAAAADRADRNARAAAKRQEKAAALLTANGSLLTNGNFETEAKGKAWPCDWGSPKGGLIWGEEAGNRFLGMKSSKPGAMVMVYRTFDVPAETKALEMTWRQRVTGFKRGEKPWFDARIMMDCFDSGGKKLKQPPAAFSARDTKGWVQKEKSFLLPEGTVTVAIMPALFQAAAGTFDLDDIVIKPTDPAPLLAKVKAAEAMARARFVPPEEPDKAKWPKEIHVKGNRLVDPQGKEVWLQGLNAGGLETLPGDDNPVKSAVVGVDVWKANVIRLPLSSEFWFGKSAYQKDQGAKYRETVDKIVTLVANRGAYVALDLHRFRAPTAEDAAFWKDMAARYKNHPAVLFDLFNEPFGTSWKVWRDGGFVGKKQGVDETAFLSDAEKKKNQGFQSIGMQALIDTVRATGAKNVVIVGGLDWSYDLSGILQGYAVHDQTGNGIMLSAHIYPWKSDWEGRVLKAAEKYPIFVGEVGADIKKMDFLPADRQEDPYTWVPDMLGAIQKYRLNWTGWCFHPAASPIMISDWNYTPTPFWGQFAKDALAGKKFIMKRMR